MSIKKQRKQEKLVDKESLGILQHTTGIDRYGDRRDKRNFFGIRPGDGDYDICVKLTKSGHMKNNGSRPEIFGTEVFFSATRLGIDTARSEAEEMPAFKKKTRSQENYAEFASFDPGYSFAEWLGVDPEEARKKRLKVHALRGSCWRPERTTGNHTEVTCKRCLKKLNIGVKIA